MKKTFDGYTVRSGNIADIRDGKETANGCRDNRVRPEPAAALERLSHLMQGLEGEFARSYNRRKGRTNAFWGDRYHATMIESGAHLWRCLVYIDMNMVRAGAVKHPREWAWTGYQELMGLKPVVRHGTHLLNFTIWRMNA